MVVIARMRVIFFPLSALAAAANNEASRQRGQSQQNQISSRDRRVAGPVEQVQREIRGHHRERQHNSERKNSPHARLPKLRRESRFQFLTEFRKRSLPFMAGLGFSF